MRTTQGLFAAALGFALAGCPQGSTGPAREGSTPQPAKTEPAKAAKTEPAKAGPALARVREDVALPLPSLLGHPAPEVEAKLGPPPGKGMMRSTCVRFVPERVFFACKYATQRYTDPTGTFAGVTVEYEDGIAAGVAFDGWTRGAGPVEPGPLLAAIGLELPEPPAVETPTEGVRQWNWFNNRARLRIAGKQYRVEMTSAGDAWGRTRIEVVLNDPLTDAQKRQVVAPAAPKPVP